MRYSTLSTLLPHHRPARRIAGAIAAFWLAMAAPAAAQSVVVFVNGEPITQMDVASRAKLIQVSTQKSASQKEVVEELINERLKLQLLKRFMIPDIDKDVDNAFTNMARRTGMSAAQFGDQLSKSGVSVATLKARIKAEMVWSQIVRSRYQSSFQFSDRDILAKLETKGGEAKTATGFDYTLRPIVFVVPRGADASVREQRRREADALRARFQSCEQGIRIARGLREVAVRASVVRSSADLPPALRDILEKTEVGKLSAPEVTNQGVEVYALCGKKASSQDNAPGRREVREELASAQFKDRSDAYLKELRGQAMIEYR